jgi:hypothetical protein
VTTPQTVSDYDLYDLVRVVATFVGTDGVTPADPSTIVLLVKDASGIVASYLYTGGAGGGSITRVGTGAYARDLTVNVTGSWFYRWQGTGGIQAAEEWTLYVRRSFIL